MDRDDLKLAVIGAIGGGFGATLVYLAILLYNASV